MVKPYPVLAAVTAALLSAVSAIPTNIERQSCDGPCALLLIDYNINVPQPWKIPIDGTPYNFSIGNASDVKQIVLNNIEDATAVMCTAKWSTAQGSEISVGFERQTPAVTPDSAVSLETVLCFGTKRARDTEPTVNFDVYVEWTDVPHHLIGFPLESGYSGLTENLTDIREIVIVSAVGANYLDVKCWVKWLTGTTTPPFTIIDDGPFTTKYPKKPQSPLWTLFAVGCKVSSSSSKLSAKPDRRDEDGVSLDVYVDGQKDYYQINMPLNGVFKGLDPNITNVDHIEMEHELDGSFPDAQCIPVWQGDGIDWNPGKLIVGGSPGTPPSDGLTLVAMGCDVPTLRSKSSEAPSAGLELIEVKTTNRETNSETELGRRDTQEANFRIYVASGNSYTLDSRPLNGALEATYKGITDVFHIVITDAIGASLSDVECISEWKNSTAGVSIGHPFTSDSPGVPPAPGLKLTSIGCGLWTPGSKLSEIFPSVDLELIGDESTNNRATPSRRDEPPQAHLDIYVGVQTDFQLVKESRPINGAWIATKSNLSNVFQIALTGTDGVSLPKVACTPWWLNGTTPVEGHEFAQQSLGIPPADNLKLMGIACAIWDPSSKLSATSSPPSAGLELSGVPTTHNAARQVTPKRNISLMVDTYQIDNKTPAHLAGLPLDDVLHMFDENVTNVDYVVVSREYIPHWEFNCLPVWQYEEKVWQGERFGSSDQSPAQAKPGRPGQTGVSLVALGCKIGKLARRSEPVVDINIFTGNDEQPSAVLCVPIDGIDRVELSMEDVREVAVKQTPSDLVPNVVCDPYWSNGKEELVGRTFNSEHASQPSQADLILTGITCWTPGQRSMI